MDALGGGMEMQQNPMDMQNNPPMTQDNSMVDGIDDTNDVANNAGLDDEINPKKTLQQLTGKLSQELRNYNNDQEQPDEDLNKYVAGMIIPQATKAMTDKGKKEVINKIKKGITDDEIEETEVDNDIQMESKIYEIINNILDDNEKQKTSKISNKTLPKRSPFRSNR